MHVLGLVPLSWAFALQVKQPEILELLHVVQVEEQADIKQVYDKSSKHGIT